jgi:putative FmdB family regulatory protein
MVFEFECVGCGLFLEAPGRVGSPPPPPACPECGGHTRRVYSSPGIIIRPWGYNLPPGHPDYFKFDEDRLEDEHRQAMRKARKVLRLDRLVSYGPGPLKPGGFVNG